MMIPLNLPSAKLSVRRRAGNLLVLCLIRRKWLRLTPEEWVRQHLINYLVEYKSIPNGRIAIEMTITYNGMNRRCDLVIVDELAQPVVIVECKSPDVTLGTAVFEQIAQYNRVLNVDVLLVSNGLEHIIIRVNKVDGKLEFLQDLPEL